MPAPATRRRRAAAALIPLFVLALSLGLVLAWAFGRDRDGSTAMAELPGKSPARAASSVAEPPLEPVASRVAESAAPAAPIAEPAASPQSAPGLRLRFLRGSTGMPSPELGVRLLARLDDGMEWVVDEGGPALVEGRTDAHGFLEVPAKLLAEGFEIVLEPRDGSPCTAWPKSLLPAQLAAAEAILDVAVLGTWASFEARVLGDDGRPVAGAQVQFDFESPSLAYSTREPPSTRVASDALGIARIELVDPASVGGRLRIKADLDGVGHSATVELPPPLKSARVELRLATAASARLRIEDGSGAPLSGAMARLERLEPPFASVGRSTDPQGSATFRPLEPGRYAASAEDPSTGASARSEFVLGQCQAADLQLVLPPSAHPLAVAGHVRGADGRPVTWHWVSVCVDGREEVRIPTDAAGRFRYHRAPCERLRVRLQAPLDGPRVEPEVLDVAFGTDDVEFVLGDAPRFGFVALEVLDRATRAPLAGVAAAVFADSSAERIGGVVSALAGSPMYLASNESGLLYVPSGAQLPRAYLVVEKRGYVRRELALEDLARLPQREGRPTLELEAGYLRRWVVLDARTGRPVAGAIATRDLDPFTGVPVDDGAVWRPSAPSDARGVLELALAQAPSRVSIQAPGYHPRTVDVGTVPVHGGGGLSLSDAVLLEAQR